jgi:hypothetical protein
MATRATQQHKNNRKKENRPSVAADTATRFEAVPELSPPPGAMPCTVSPVRGKRRWGLVRQKPTDPPEHFSREIQIPAYFP